jgi:Lipocalin-like domain
MNRRNMLGTLATATLGLAFTTADAAAQQKSFKDLIVGSWTLLINDFARQDGTKVPAFGPNPKGLVVFGPDGRYSLQIARDVRPKFASNDRYNGTSDENKAAMQGAISHFGRYTIDEAQKTLTFRIEASSFPNWDNTTQKRPITVLTGDDLVWSNPTPSTGPSGFVNAELIWRRAK